MTVAAFFKKSGLFVVLKLDFNSESPDGFLKAQIIGPYLQRF